MNVPTPKPELTAEWDAHVQTVLAAASPEWILSVEQKIDAKPSTPLESVKALSAIAHCVPRLLAVAEIAHRLRACLVAEAKRAAAAAEQRDELAATLAKVKELREKMDAQQLGGVAAMIFDTTDLLSNEIREVRRQADVIRELQALSIPPAPSVSDKPGGMK